jgi:hypothetical protein
LRVSSTLKLKRKSCIKVGISCGSQQCLCCNF